MLAKILLLSGGVLYLICQLAGLVSALIALAPVMDGGATPLAVLAGGSVLLLLVHEAGHLLACVALRVPVTGVYLGRNKHAVRFRLRGVQVSLGMPNAGGVQHGPAGSSKRTAVIGAAGPAANLAVAAVLLAIQVALPAGTTARDVLLALAALSAAMGVGNLIPFRTRSGHLSDGARLLTLGSEKLARALRVRTVTAPDEKAWKVTPSKAVTVALVAELNAFRTAPTGAAPQPERTDRWLAEYRKGNVQLLASAGLLGMALRQEGRITELHDLQSGYPEPFDPFTRQMLNSTLVLAWEVLVPPDVPAAAVQRAAASAQQLVDSHASADSEVRRDIARRTLALARLRQGRYDEVEPLCAAALANPKLARRPRATVLATVALARQRLGQPYEAMLAEAQSLAPDAELVEEAAASRDSSAHPLCRVRLPLLSVEEGASRDKDPVAALIGDALRQLAGGGDAAYSRSVDQLSAQWSPGWPGEVSRTLTGFLKKDTLGNSRTKAFRQSFLVSYAVRIGERLAAAAARAEHEAVAEHEKAPARSASIMPSPGSDLVPFLAARQEEVDDAVSELFGGRLKRGRSARVPASPERSEHAPSPQTGRVCA